MALITGEVLNFSATPITVATNTWGYDTTINSTSGNWSGNYISLNTTSGNWSRNYTFPNSTSGNQRRFYTEFEPTVGNIAEIIILGIVCVMILLGNSLVILAFIKGPRSIRTHTNCFVVNLAVGDFMVGCLSVPFWMCVKLRVVDTTFSQYFISLDVLFGATSIFSLVAISLERMAAVHYATFHYNMSSKPVICSICATWFIGFVLFALRIYIGAKHLFEFTITIFVVSFVLPFFIIIWSYIVLFVTAYKLQRADNVTRAHSVKRDIHIAKTISIIIGLLFICWAPFFILNLLYVVCKNCLADYQLVLLVSISKVMHYSNSMMNFFVYAVRSPEFRKTFDALVFNGCKTEHLRERLRTISVNTRKRGGSLLRRSHHADSLMDMGNRTDHHHETTKGRASTTLMVPKTNGNQSHSFTSDTYLTDCSESPYPYQHN